MANLPPKYSESDYAWIKEGARVRLDDGEPGVIYSRDESRHGKDFVDDVYVTPDALPNHTVRTNVYGVTPLDASDPDTVDTRADQIRPGDRVDLEGRGEGFESCEFEYATCESLELEEASCIRLDFSGLPSLGCYPDEMLKVRRRELFDDCAAWVEEEAAQLADATRPAPTGLRGEILEHAPASGPPLGKLSPR